MKIFNLKLVKIRLCFWLLLNSQIFESSELFAIIIVKHIFINYYMNQETNFILQICSSFGIIILLNCFFFFFDNFVHVCRIFWSPSSLHPLPSSHNIFPFPTTKYLHNSFHFCFVSIVALWPNGFYQGSSHRHECEAILWNICTSLVATSLQTRTSFLKESSTVTSSFSCVRPHWLLRNLWLKVDRPTLVQAICQWPE